MSARSGRHHRRRTRFVIWPIRNAVVVRLLGMIFKRAAHRLGMNVIVRVIHITVPMPVRMSVAVRVFMPVRLPVLVHPARQRRHDAGARNDARRQQNQQRPIRQAHDA